MISLSENDSTLKDCSFDETHKIYMSNSLIEVKNFDNVKGEYLKNLNIGGVEHIYSNDALLYCNNHWYFIEFKNGAIDSRVRAEIKSKMYDSLLIACDLLGITIGKSRSSMTYICVYNEDISHFNHGDNKCKGRDNYIMAMVGNLANKAKLDTDMMKISQYKGLYFKDVKVLNKTEFHYYTKNFC